MEDERDIIRTMFILLLLGLCVWLGFAYRAEKDDKEQKKEEYSMETYYDEDLGIKMLIFKDKVGDVLYCEPVEVEMEER